MNIAARKSKLIEELKKINDANLISKLEKLLSSKSKIKNTQNLHKFSGIWSNEDAEEMKSIIDTHCSNIDENEWK